MSAGELAIFDATRRENTPSSLQNATALYVISVGKFTSIILFHYYLSAL